MTTEREDLLALIEKLPDEKLRDARIGMEQLLTADADWRKRMQEEYQGICRRMAASLENVPIPAGSRSASNAGGGWQTDEVGVVLDPVFSDYWYEDDRATLVLQMKWTFGPQGFLVLIRVRRSEDGRSHVCAVQVAGPGRSILHEESFSVLPMASAD